MYFVRGLSIFIYAVCILLKITPSLVKLILLTFYKINCPTFMRQNYSAFLLFNILLLICTGVLSCQELKDDYNWFDQVVGIENTGLYDGVVYMEKYRMINAETKFFTSPDFLAGSVIYDGKPYYDQHLKYDVFGDDLLLKVKDRLGGFTIKLFKEKIAGFTIDGHTFTKVPDPSGDSVNMGFYEVVIDNDQFKLFTKHLKRDIVRKDRKTRYYEFLDLKKQQVLFYNGSYHSIRSKKDLTELFPPLKKEIDSFYRVARSLRNSDPDAFMKALITRIQTLVPPENKQTAE